MCGFRDFAFCDFLEGVDALAGGVEGVHEMHGGGSGPGVLLADMLFAGDVAGSWCCSAI